LGRIPGQNAVVVQANDIQEKPELAGTSTAPANFASQTPLWPEHEYLTVDIGYGDFSRAQYNSAGYLVQHVFFCIGTTADLCLFGQRYSWQNRRVEWIDNCSVGR